MKDLIAKINHLANKSKTIGLTEEEKQKQQELRQEYLEIFRSNMKNTLMNVKIVDEEGNDITPEKLKLEQKKSSLN